MKKLVQALVLLAVITALLSPAHAHHKGGHDGGPATITADVCREGAGDNKHPSGKDRSCEAGGSSPQGNASSDPDDNGRGPDRSNDGADKSGGPGGVDKDDQDGNNGCGNDDDFEDDNEGRCGGPPTAPSPTPTVGPSPTPTAPTHSPSLTVGPTPTLVPTDSPSPGPSVPGDVPGLPTTGEYLVTWVILGILLLLTGGTVYSYTRTRR